MTATTTTPSPTAGPTAGAGAPPQGVTAPGGSLLRPVSFVAGAALLAAPLLVVAGIVTSPPQESRATSDYIESLARDPFLTSLSANLLHYGWVSLALGLVVSMTLVRGRRGRALTLVGGLGGGFVSVQMSALLYNDWVLSALGRELDLPTATRVAEAWMVHGDLSQQLAWKCATAALVLPVLLYAGLARAGVVSWLLVPLALFPMVAPFVVMGLVGGASEQLVGGDALGVAAGVVTGLVCYLPTFLVGLRLIGRARLADA